MRKISMRRVAATVVALALLLMTMAATLPSAQARPATSARPLNCPLCPPTYADGTSVAFPHTASASNSAGDYTVLDNPHTNNQPNAILLVTPFWNYPQGSAGVYDNHHIGVWYNGSRWTIFNQDGTAIPVGASFSVLAQTASAGIFVATATAQNISGNTTRLSNALFNNNPSVNILVTPVYGSTALYNTHNIGVWYNGSQWTIYNEDSAAMQPGEMFDVFDFDAASIGSVCYQQHTSVSNIAGDYTTLSDGFSNNGLTWETHNWGVSGPYLNHPTGVFIYGSPWGSANSHGAIFDEDLAAMVSGATFNYCVITQ